MKHLLHTLKDKADNILQNSTATRNRPPSFQIVVAAIFALDLLAFISFCIMKIISG